MGLAIEEADLSLTKKEITFQFPFRRDGPCNRIAEIRLEGRGSCFNSLFVGMGLAIGLNDQR